MFPFFLRVAAALGFLPDFWHIYDAADADELIVKQRRPSHFSIKNPIYDSSWTSTLPHICELRSIAHLARFLKIIWQINDINSFVSILNFFALLWNTIRFVPELECVLFACRVQFDLNWVQNLSKIEFSIFFSAWPFAPIGFKLSDLHALASPPGSPHPIERIVPFPAKTCSRLFVNLFSGPSATVLQMKQKCGLAFT